jgi:hypothetical protein
VNGNRSSLGTRRRLAVGVLAATAALAGAGVASAAVKVTNVTFGGNSTAPTITITGTGFGSHAPTAYSAANTSCGSYGSGNGNWYGTNGLWFFDSTNAWQAGDGTASGGNCIGLVVQSWTATQVVFTFGIAYGSFDHWTVDPGDHFVIDLKKFYWGGVASYS